ncbi:MAG: Lrp/AsnC family transcriptional regulator [Rhodobiaceae bacterium]|nr:Lrp/AsnC family transcriptional regulator [Rhodobiaceae bacterium]MCC0052562.1 Lrp/AsnC family transcriptional regulator [Rhodobiaceae bacterium]
MDRVPDTADRILLDRFQHDFPLVAHPFAAVGEAAGVDEAEAIARYRVMQSGGLLTRIGAVVAPNTLGASTLCAMDVPAAGLERTAELVNAEPGVNHNYEREGTPNLWFVVTAASEGDLEATLARIAAQSGYSVRDLRLEEPFHLDLGFPVFGSNGKATRRKLPIARSDAIEPGDRDLLGAIEDGLPLCERPYEAVANEIGTGEAEVLASLQRLCEAGVIRRFGVVLRHHRLGITANAMAVWDIPDDAASQIGNALAACDGVTLCYRRRRAHDWPFNVYCMVHARSRAAAQDVIAKLHAIASPHARGHAVLFSRHCFKQTGARFSRTGRAA